MLHRCAAASALSGLSKQVQYKTKIKNFDLYARRVILRKTLVCRFQVEVCLKGKIRAGF